MVFVLVMTWYDHVSRDTLSVIGLSDQASVSSGRSKQARRGRRLFPHRVRIQRRCRCSFRDMFIKDGDDVRLSDLGIPRVVRIDDDRRALLAGAEATCGAHEDFSGRDCALHQSHVEGHEQLRSTGRPARRFRVAGGTGIGTDKNMIFWFWHSLPNKKSIWNM